MEIEKVEYKDTISIKKMLVNSPSIVDTGKLLPEILEHIDKEGCVAKKVVDGDRLLGVWLSKEYETHTSLSYFYVAEELRSKRIVLEFFMSCVVLINKGKPLIICTKDTTGFSKYIEPIEGQKDTYMFKGFR